MHPMLKAHISRLRTQVLKETGVTTYSEWVLQNVMLHGRPFSFKGHEYQKFIMDYKSRVKVFKKCSQIGMSIWAVSFTLAFCNLHNGVTVLYILPSGIFSQQFAKGRVDPIIDESPNIRNAIYPGSDSSLLKRFVNNSFVYFKGASRSAQAISVPADAITIDEMDFAENEEILTQFTSRLTHSPHKLEIKLSTPTVTGYGISAAYDNSKKHVELQKCCHCNHWFKPDYFKHIILPGFNDGPNPKDIRTINFLNKHILDRYDIRTAYLQCPKCHKPVDQDIKYRKWVCENPDSNSEAAGFHITPFSAPAFIKPADLLRMAVSYKDYADFINFGLGESHDAAENALSKSEIENLFINTETASTGLRIMGIDLGGTCACFVGTVNPIDNSILVEHAERIPLRKLKTRYSELCARYGIICSVMDAFPYTDLVMSLQDLDHNLWAAVFTTSKNVELYTYKYVEEDEEKALYGMRQVSIARNRAMDYIVNMLRAGKIKFRNCPEKATIIDQLTDPKRIKMVNKFGDEEYVWRKSAKGQDHYFFALVYLAIAHLMRGMSQQPMTLPFLATSINLNKKSNHVRA